MIEQAGSLISIDSYQHEGLLGVYPDGLKVKESLEGPWIEYSGGCGLTDATELVSASYCNGEFISLNLRRILHFRNVLTCIFDDQSMSTFQFKVCSRFH